MFKTNSWWLNNKRLLKFTKYKFLTETPPIEEFNDLIKKKIGHKFQKW